MGDTRLPGPTQPPIAFNVKDFLKDLGKEFLAKMTTVVVNKYATKYIGGLLNKYGIRNMVLYAINLKNQVEVGQAIQNDTQRDKYIIKSIISDFDHLPGNHLVTLGPMFQQDALRVYDITKNPSQAKNNADFSIQLANSGNFLGTPYGQQMSKVSYAMAVNQKAMGAATQEIAQSQGFKSSYACAGINPDNAGIYDIQDAEKITACGVQNPAFLINTEIAAQTNGFWMKNQNPNDRNAIYADIIATIGSGIIAQKLHLGGANGGLLPGGGSGSGSGSGSNCTASSIGGGITLSQISPNYDSSGALVSITYTVSPDNGALGQQCTNSMTTYVLPGSGSGSPVIIDRPNWGENTGTVSGVIPVGDINFLTVKIKVQFEAPSGDDLTDTISSTIPTKQ